MSKEDYEMINFATKEYQNLIDSVKDYSEWSDKIKEEIGDHISTIYGIQVPSNTAEEAMNYFQKQDFFK